MLATPSLHSRPYGRLLTLAILFIGATGAVAFGQTAPTPGVQPGTPSELRVWNRPIVTFRAELNGVAPVQRAANARARIESIAQRDLGGKIQAQAARVGELQGVMITLGAMPLLAILPEDLDPESGETLETLGNGAAARLDDLLRARREQMRWPVFLRGLGLSAAATVAYGLVAWGLAVARRRARSRIEAALARRRVAIAGVDMIPAIAFLEQGALRILRFALLAIATFVWLTFVLEQFPYSYPLGASLAEFLSGMFAAAMSATADAMPSLFAAVAILFITKIAANAVTRFLEGVQRGIFAVEWLAPEQAHATRRIAFGLVWAMGIALAYPHIPGSDTAVFKGISVLLGLMLTLGSAGLVNQWMSGLIILYSRTCKVGDFVNLGDTIGVVTEMGALATKVRNIQRQEITVPNTLVVSGKVVNFSRLAAQDGALLSIPLSIGYDTPWQQVNELLLRAAERTPGVRREPKARVLQVELGDFYVVYQLHVSIERAEERFQTLSDLNTHILDAFNEAGVQIMSPHFEGQPEQKVVAPVARGK